MTFRTPVVIFAVAIGFLLVALILSFSFITKAQTSEKKLMLMVHGGEVTVAAEGVPFATRIMTENVTGSPVVITAAKLPAGAVFTDNGNGTAVFRWTPGFNQGPKDMSRGTLKYTIPLTATAGGERDSLEMVVGVAAADAPVTKTPLPEPVVMPGKTVAVDLSAHSPVPAAVGPESTNNVTMTLVEPEKYASGNWSLTPKINPGQYTLSFTPDKAGYQYLRVEFTDEFGKKRIAPITFRAGEMTESVKSGSWNDPAVWSGGTVPGRNNLVMINGHQITIDGNQEVVDLTVENGGKLYFSRQANTHLKLGGSLMVMGASTLDVGNAASPIPAGVKAIISFAVNNNQDVFKGNNPYLPPGMARGDVGLWVMDKGSVLTAQGAEKSGWTRLAQDAAAGATTLTVDGPVSGWQAGDKIVITATHKGAQPQVLTIADVIGRQITVQEPLNAMREGSLYAYNKTSHQIRQITSKSELSADDIFVPVRAAIGNLTRNVLIYSSLVTDSDVAHRAHLMIMMRAEARLANAEVRDLGPFAKMGRYAIHFHKLGEEGAKSSLRSVAVWNTPFENPGGKLLTIHQTDNLTVEDGVFYNARARGIWTESGGCPEETTSGQIFNCGEKGNVLRDNLVVRTVGSEPLANDADIRTNNGVKRSAAGIWISGGNILTGNVVANAVVAADFGAGFYLDRARDKDSDLVRHPTVFRNLESYGNGGPGFQANGAEEINVDGLLAWRNEDGGYFQYSGSGVEQRLIHNSVFFGNPTGAFNYHSTRDRFEDNLFLGEFPKKTGQTLSPQKVGFSDSRDGHPSFRGNIFDGNYFSISKTAHMTFEGNYVRDGQITPVLDAGGGPMEGKGRIISFSSFLRNSGAAFNGYPAVFKLLSRLAPRPAADAIFDKPTRSWLFVSSLPAGGRIYGNAITADGRLDPAVRVAILHNGYLLGSYQQDRASLVYDDTTEADKEGYTNLLPPGFYEALLSKAGYRPEVFSVNLAAGQTVQLPRITLQPGMPVLTALDPNALTITIQSQSRPAANLSPLDNPSVWVMGAVGELLDYRQLEGSKPSFTIPKGEYTILVRHDDFQTNVLTTTTADNSILAGMIAQAYDPSIQQGKIASILRGRDGQPVAGATVQLAREGGRLERVTLSQTNGSYSLSGLSAGSYSILAVKDGVPVGAFRATVTEADASPEPEEAPLPPPLPPPAPASPPPPPPPAVTITAPVEQQAVSVTKPLQMEALIAHNPEESYCLEISLGDRSLSRSDFSNLTLSNLLPLCSDSTGQIINPE